MAHLSPALLLAGFLNFIEFVEAKRTALHDALVVDDSLFSPVSKSPRCSQEAAFRALSL